MRRKRRTHSPEFKAKVAMAELLKKYDVHANQVTDWKRQLLDGAADVFGKGAQKSEATDEIIEQLRAKIGRLTIDTNRHIELSPTRNDASTNITHDRP